MIPRVLVIAGSDSGGGAGIQADIKTVTMLGGHAMTAITAITAQNTLGVQAVHAVPTGIVLAQIRSVIDDIGVDAIKIGMIGSAATAHAVADVLEELATRHGHFPGEGRGPVATPDNGEGGAIHHRRLQLDPGLCRGGSGAVPIIFDPVMVATSGSILADADTIAAFARLIALATVATPNLPELAVLGGEDAVLGRGAALLVKGGHGDGPRLEDRLIDRDGTETIWTHLRRDTPHTHGTGCTLASGIATGLATGQSLVNATARAIAFVQAALAAAPGIGAGHGPMGHALNTIPYDELARRCPA